MILRDRDTTGNGTLDERVYHLQNWRSDVVALISAAGTQIEQVRYEPYGTPFGIPAGDTNADGDVTSGDVSQVTTWYSTSAYDIRGDLDMDSVVSISDVAYVAANEYLGHSTGRGELSLVANRKGYAGYENLAELEASGTKWDVRNRVLISEIGTWTRRDPLGYVDGMSLGEYVESSPVSRLDPTGTSWTNYHFALFYYHNPIFNFPLQLFVAGRASDYESHEAVIRHESMLLTGLRTQLTIMGSAAAGGLNCRCDGYDDPVSHTFSGRRTSTIGREEFIDPAAVVPYYFWFIDWTYAIGAHKLHLDYGSCHLYAECESPGVASYVVACSDNFFRMRDRFADPFDMQDVASYFGWPPGQGLANIFQDFAGTPYRILHDYPAPNVVVSGFVGTGMACPGGLH